MRKASRVFATSSAPKHSKTAGLAEYLMTKSAGERTLLWFTERTEKLYGGVG